MAEIELVIRINEEDFNKMKHNVAIGKPICSLSEPEMVSKVANGIPLPKGHGRIADIDKVLEEMKATRTYDIPFALGRVKPIIPADTESED